VTYEEALKRIDTDPDFIYCKRFDNSLEKCLDRHPDGAPTKLIAQALMMTEEQVEELYTGVVQKLRKIMKIE
jgi:hypothetical protein